MHRASGSDDIRVQSNPLRRVDVDGYGLALIPPLPEAQNMRAWRDRQLKGLARKDHPSLLGV
jgi:hypothetical protein